MKVVVNGNVFLPTQNLELSPSQLGEMPRFLMKKYSLWNKFELSAKEREEIEKMTLQQAIEADRKDLAEKEAKILAAIETSVKKSKKETTTEKEATE